LRANFTERPPGPVGVVDFRSPGNQRAGLFVRRNQVETARRSIGEVLSQGHVNLVDRALDLCRTRYQSRQVECECHSSYRDQRPKDGKEELAHKASRPKGASVLE